MKALIVSIVLFIAGMVALMFFAGVSGVGFEGGQVYLLLQEDIAGDPFGSGPTFVQLNWGIVSAFCCAILAFFAVIYLIGSYFENRSKSDGE